MDESYKKWTVCKKTNQGYSIECKKGLWGVYAPTKQEAEREAKHYFVRYFLDGEYS